MNRQYFHKWLFRSSFICLAIGMIVSLQQRVLAQPQTTTEAIAEQEAQVNQLEQQITAALQSINDNQQSISQLQTEIDTLAQRQKEIQAEIVVQQEKVNQRLQAMEDRLVAIQLSRLSASSFLTLLGSENFSDLVQRFFVFQQIFTNDQQMIQETNRAIEYLDRLENEIVTNQAQLVAKHDALTEQSTTMNQEIAQLKQTLSDNQATFALLQVRNKKEEQAALASKEAINQAQAATIDSSSVSESSHSTSSTVQSVTVESISQASSTAAAPNQSSSSESSSSAAESLKESTTPAPQTNGRQLTVRATAYSYNEPGLTYFTAMGYDLRQNPMMVAVDPTVIPLGSIVEVPGYGVAIAGDTGGAIKGNKIDLHYVDLQTAKNYGVQTVTITIY